MLVIAIWILVFYSLLCIGFCVFGTYITQANQWFVNNPICKKGNMFENDQIMSLLGPDAEIHKTFYKIECKDTIKIKIEIETCAFFVIQLIHG